MDYGNPLANGLSEQVCGVFQRGSQSPGMGLEIADARPSPAQTPPDTRGTYHDLNIVALTELKLAPQRFIWSKQPPAPPASCSVERKPTSASYPNSPGYPCLG